jgi:hypothetical protein
MSLRANVYIRSVIVLGAILLAGCMIFEREFTDLSKWLGYLLLACIGSILKISLPKIHGTMSINFLFILIGIAELTLAETMTLACAAALVQCLWRPKKQPTLIQVLFNVCVLITSVDFSFSMVRVLVHFQSLPILLAVAVCTYFVVNTGMVSLVLSLIEEKPLIKVWRQCYLWSFPYYLVGAAIAGAIAFSSRTVGWKQSLLMLPLMYLVYLFYRMYLLHQAEADY